MDKKRMDVIKKDEEFVVKWEKIKPSILKILNQERISEDERQDFFLHARSEYFLNKTAAIHLHKEFKIIILNCILSIKEKIHSHLDDYALLKAYVVEWKNFTDYSMQLSLPFDKANNYVIKCLLLQEWKKNIVLKVQHRLLKVAMNIVNAERNDEAFDSQLVIVLRQSFVTLSMNYQMFYRQNFEVLYVKDVEAFYENDAIKNFKEDEIVKYMRYAHDKLREEEARAKKYLDFDLSYETVYKTCIRVLFAKFKDSVTAKCAKMLKENDMIQLQLMFRLNERIPDGIKPMCDALEQFIFDDGLAEMLSSAATITNDLEKYVEKVLSLFNRFSELVTRAFDNDKRFADSRDSGFRLLVNDISVFKLEIPSDEKSVNSAKLKFPKFLSTFCDILLRKTAISKKLTSDQIEKKLKDAILILRYVLDIDMFIQFYKSQLTKRLILGTSLNIEKEENMITWIRDDAKAPTDCMSKLNQMLRDVKISEELSEQFKKENNGRLNGLNVQILTTNIWCGSCDKVSVSLPKELEVLLPKFETFYSSKHNKRKLHWNHKMSHGVISFTNSIGKFDLGVNTLQMSVLYVWNDPSVGEISFEAIKLATQLSDFDVKKTLLSLIASSKMNRQIVCCKTELKSIEDFQINTQFYINEEFGIVKNGKLRTKGSVNVY